MKTITVQLTEREADCVLDSLRDAYQNTQSKITEISRLEEKTKISRTNTKETLINEVRDIVDAGRKINIAVKNLK